MGFGRQLVCVALLVCFTVSFARPLVDEATSNTATRSLLGDKDYDYDEKDGKDHYKGKVHHHYYPPPPPSPPPPAPDSPPAPYHHYKGKDHHYKGKDYDEEDDYSYGKKG